MRDLTLFPRDQLNLPARAIIFKFYPCRFWSRSKTTTTAQALLAVAGSLDVNFSLPSCSALHLLSLKAVLIRPLPLFSFSQGPDRKAKLEEWSQPMPAKDCPFQRSILSGKPLESFQRIRVILDCAAFAKYVARPPEGGGQV